MEREELAKVIEAIKILPFRPDDIIVIKSEHFFSDDSRDSLKKFCSETFGHRKVVVLDGGMDIEVLRREQP